MFNAMQASGAQNVYGNNNGANDTYETPTTQMVLLKGQSCIETISLPSLQTYYTNMQLPKRESGYFSINHFDFPLNDSLTKTFGGTSILVYLTVQTLVVNAASILTGIPDETLQSVTAFAFDLRRLHSPADVVLQLNRQIMMLAGMNLDEKYWYLWFSGIFFDPVSSKFVCTFNQPNFASPNEYLGYQRSMSTVRAVYDDVAHGPYWPEQLVITISGQQTGVAGELAAAIFGGVVNADGTWQSQFDTGITNWFMNSLTQQGNDQLEVYYTGQTTMSVQGQRPPRMYVDPYVYLMGAPEQSMWNPDGTVSQVMALEPRNRIPGQITSQQSYVAGQSHRTKTSLQALRSMTLRFCDSKGRTLQLDEEYVIKIAIEFQQ